MSENNAMKDTNVSPEGEVQNRDDMTPDDRIDFTATMVCVYVVVGALILIAAIFRAASPREPSLPQILPGMFSYLLFPLAAYLAARNTLTYIRLLHERPRGN